MKRVIHFEIHAVNPEQVAAFYQMVFDWKITKWEGSEEYWLIKTGEGPGIDGGLFRRRGPAPSDDAPINGAVNTIDVENVSETMNKIITNGGRMVVPKMAIPGIGWLAYFKDTDGNVFGVMQSDREAK